MPDFLKKAAKQTREVCGEAEEPLAALFTRPRVGEDVKRLGTPGGRTSKMSKLADTGPDEIEHVEDVRERMFGQNAVLVLTPERLLAFEHGTYSGRVKGLLGEVPLSEISAIELDAPPIGESGPAWLEITFTDGEAVSLAPGTRRRRFVQAFDDIAQPA